MARPPIFGKAMTDVERKQRSRAKKRLQQLIDRRVRRARELGRSITPDEIEDEIEAELKEGDSPSDDPLTTDDLESARLTDAQLAELIWKP